MNKELNVFDNEGFEESMKTPLLTKEERGALNKVGIKTQTFYTVQYPDTREVIAMFKESQWAEDWKWVNCRTGIIVPFEMQVK